MPVRFEYALDILEANPPAAIDDPSLPICSIEMHLRQRYRLEVPTNEGVVITLDDVVSPEHTSSFRIPIIHPLSMWRELYLPAVLNHSNLHTLKPKIVGAAFNMAQRSGGKGFKMVVKVGIVKTELMDKEEVDRIARKLANTVGENSN